MNIPPLPDPPKELSIQPILLHSLGRDEAEDDEGPATRDEEGEVGGGGDESDEVGGEGVERAEVGLEARDAVRAQDEEEL